MKQQPTFSVLWVIITILVGGVVSGLVALMVVVSDQVPDQPVSEMPAAVDTGDWETFTSDEFNVSLRYPSDWEVNVHSPDLEGDQSVRFIVPAINVVPADTVGSTPFDHFADRPNVSIYPYGIPTEGVSGEQEPSAVPFAEETVRAVDYVLADGSPWATYAVFAHPPESWEAWGFVWARTTVNGLVVECFADGRLVSDNECDPLSGHQLIRAGTVSAEERAIVEVILESVRFRNR
ncbi:MAG: hypothetical protein WD049_04025 [Candidatus Paceibacterota bacterium]